MARTLAQMPGVTVAADETETGQLAAHLARCAQEHGPIFRRIVQQGPAAGQELVFMVGPEANRFVLHTHRAAFSHEQGWTPVIGELFGKGLLTMDDPEHAQHRRMWNPAFAGACMDAYMPIMQRIIAERAAHWPNREVDLYQEAREITFDAAAATLAGFERGAAVDEMRALFYALLYGFNPGQETYEDYMAKALKTRERLLQIMIPLIRERRGAPASREPRDVLGMIVRARDERGETLSDAQVLAHLNILLIAGHETTTTLGAWALYLLAALPEQRARVQEEVDAMAADADGTFAIEGLRGARALDAFVRETGRLYPPVINVPRGVLRDVEFGGYTIPAGAQVRLALAAGHLLPQAFADPARFDPDRMLPPREEDRRTPYSLVTFGGGPRICIGINFAQIEVKALVAHTLRHYRLDPVAGHRPIHAGYWTAYAPGGVQVRVSRRA